MLLFQEVKRVSPVLASLKPNDAHKYAYVANLCVAKFARRQGIATNILYLAIDMAISIGNLCHFLLIFIFLKNFTCLRNGISLLIALMILYWIFLAYD